MSRSGLLLGAAGIVGAAVTLGSKPAAAHSPSSGVRTSHRPVSFTYQAHPDYHRRNFDRAHAIAEVVDPVNSKSMTLRVDDLVPLMHVADAKKGSDAWACGFSALLVRTRGDALPSGTYPTTINRRTFPLTITRVGDTTYQVVVDRRTMTTKGA